MCRFNISFNDAVVNDVRPFFPDEKKMLQWMQVEMESLMRNYVARHRRSSHVDGDQLLNNLQALPDAPEGLQLDTVLQPSQSSIEELLDEAYAEKYGI